VNDFLDDLDRMAHAALDARRSQSLLRVRRQVELVDATHLRIAGKTLLNFSGNDYLGFSQHPVMLSVWRESIQVGSGAAALVTGRTADHVRAETDIARWKGVDDAVLLPSGYQANVAAIQTTASLAEASGLTPRFLVDKLVHASLIDAIRSTQAALRVFPHNNLAKLGRLLADDGSSGRLDVVVTESVFSMDGDSAALADIAALKRDHRFALVVDEAHASGLYGEDGAGLVSQLGLTRHVDLGIATFSKALGVIGGAVYGAKALVDCVVNFGRSYIYTTSPPPAVARAITQAIQLCRDEPERRERLRANVARLRTAVASAGLQTVAGDSPIVPVLVGDEQRALDLAQNLMDRGFFVVAVRPPTVPPGTSRLRVTVSSEHTAQEIDALMHALVN
jgi:8-amino-7-oxononanoate synthase